MNKKPKIYVDMDGVLVDLFNYVGDKLGVDFYTLSQDEVDEFFMNCDPYVLFRDAPAFKTSMDLLKMVVELNGGYSILSSPLRYNKPDSIRGKAEWIDKNVTVPADEVIFEHDKFLYAKQEDGTPNILIDDFKVQLGRWASAGGEAIQYQGDKHTLEYLKEQLRRSLFMLNN